MKRKFNLFTLLILTIIISSCSNDDDDSIKVNTSTLSGTWGISEYRENGTSLSGITSYGDNYILLDKNQRFTLLTGTDDNYSYLYGTYSYTDGTLTITPDYYFDADYTTFSLDNLSRNNLDLSNESDGNSYEYDYDKVSNPATYQVANETSFSIGDYYSTDNVENVKVCPHGSLDAGTTSSFEFYSLNNSVYLMLVYNYNLYVAVYPTELTAGENTIVAMYDTTTVYHTTLRSRSIVNMNFENIENTADKMEFKDIFENK